MGVNLALNKSATASGYVLPYSASKAVNGSTTPVSRWLCNSVPSWLSVDLGANYWINRWVVRHMGVAGWQSPNYNMCDFKLQASNDNKNWYDIDSVVGNTASVSDRTFGALNFRYARVYVTKGLKCNTRYASLMEFEVYPAPASQYLSGLSISNGTLSPTPFAGKTTFAYTASVGYDVSSITVTPIAEDSHAIIRVNNVIVQNGSASGPISLNVGSNTISVQVTASDGSAYATYTITVTRAGSQYLSNLAISAGTLNPAFASGTLSYTTSIASNVSSITVTPTAQDSTATITVNGTTVVSGQASGSITMNTGSNTITVVVNARGGLSQTYTITVTKAAPASAYLSTLTLTGSSTGVIAFDQPFNGRTIFLYSAIADVDDVSVIVKPTAEDTSAAITVNTVPLVGGQASVNLSIGGTNTITIVVTPTDGGVAQTYSVNVTRPSSPYLKGLDIKVGKASSTLSWNPGPGTGFSRKIFSYTCTVTNNFNVMATLEDTAGPATMTLTVGEAAPVALNSGVLSSSIIITAGNTVRVKVIVTSKTGGDTKQYVVDVSR